MKSIKKLLALTALLCMGLFPTLASAQSCSANASCGVWCNVYGPITHCSSGSNWVSCTWYYANGAFGENYYYSC
jgi:hypothetical protein